MKKHTHGFTLIEMIVSIAIFFIVAVVAMGAVLKVLDANKKSQNIKIAITSLNFALETISRDMRVGTNYRCESWSAGAVSNNIITGAPTSITTSLGCASGITNSWLVSFNSSKSSFQSDGTTPCKLVNAFYFDKDSSSLWKGTQTRCDSTLTFFPLIYNSANPNDTQLSDSVITFTKGKVAVFAGSGIWPRAQFYFSGYTGAKEKTKNYFDVQTTLSQRLPD